MVSGLKNGAKLSDCSQLQNTDGHTQLYLNGSSLLLP